MSMENDLTINLEEIFTKLNVNGNLGILEKMIEIYLSNNPDYNPSRYVDFQIQLFSLFGSDTGKIIHLLKMDENLAYEGRHKEVYRRFLNLKVLSGNHLRNMDSVIAAPNKLKGNLFSYSDLHPYEISGSLIKNNGEYFVFTLDFNDGLSLSSSLLENLVEKLDQGANNIDRNSFYNLKEKFQSLSLKIDSIIEKEDNQIKDSN